MKRHITLYYASISLRNTVLSLLWWLISFWRSPAQRRALLTEQIWQTYHEGSWFVFGSARSGLAAFLKAAGVGRGDEVIISSYTCLAVPTAIVAVGAIPVYVDINPLSLNLDEQLLWPAITDRTKAIIIQHTLGNPAPIVEIKRKALAKGLLVIEDCALSLGTKIGDQYVGTLGDAAIFSMELSKTLSSGWGGLLLVNNVNLVSEIKRVYDDVPEQGIVQSTRDIIQTIISTWCSYPTLLEFPGKYVWWLCVKTGLFRQSTPESEFDGVVAPNFIRKMGGAQTLLAILQWQNFRKITEACTANHVFFCDSLKSLGYTVHAEMNQSVVQVANRVSFLVKNPPQIIEFFRRERISLGTWFDGPLSPVPTALAFNYQTGSYPCAEHVARHVVNIPCHNRLSIGDKKRIVEMLKLYSKMHPDAPYV
jgi:perosamine synthetase